MNRWESLSWLLISPFHIGYQLSLGEVTGSCFPRLMGREIPGWMNIDSKNAKSRLKDFFGSHRCKRSQSSISLIFGLRPRSAPNHTHITRPLSATATPLILKMGFSCCGERDPSPVNFIPVRNRHQPGPQMVYRMPNREVLNTFPNTRMDTWADPRAWPGHRISTNHQASSNRYGGPSHRGRSSFRDGSSRRGGSVIPESPVRPEMRNLNSPGRHMDSWLRDTGIRYPPRSRQGDIPIEPTSGYDRSRKASSQRGSESGYDMPSRPKTARTRRSSRQRGAGNVYGGKSVHGGNPAETVLLFGSRDL